MSTREMVEACLHIVETQAQKIEGSDFHVLDPEVRLIRADDRPYAAGLDPIFLSNA